MAFKNIICQNLETQLNNFLDILLSYLQFHTFIVKGSSSQYFSICPHSVYARSPSFQTATAPNTLSHLTSLVLGAQQCTSQVHVEYIASLLSSSDTLKILNKKVAQQGKHCKIGPGILKTKTKKWHKQILGSII